MRLIRKLLGKPPYWMPTLDGPLRPLWPLYKAHVWRQELKDLGVPWYRRWRKKNHHYVEELHAD
jgi:hypothetical protein